MKSFTYDKANQLVTSAFDAKVTNYTHNAAGRLIKGCDKNKKSYDAAGMTATLASQNPTTTMASQ